LVLAGLLRLAERILYLILLPLQVVDVALRMAALPLRWAVLAVVEITTAGLLGLTAQQDRVIKAVIQFQVAVVAVVALELSAQMQLLPRLGTAALGLIPPLQEHLFTMQAAAAADSRLHMLEIIPEREALAAAAMAEQSIQLPLLALPILAAAVVVVLILVELEALAVQVLLF
jgi:hypothetical protein